MTMLSVTNKPIMLDVIILSVIKLIAVMVSVVTPSNHLKITFSGKKKEKTFNFPLVATFPPKLQRNKRGQ
jgi:hypothetical protein